MAEVDASEVLDDLEEEEEETSKEEETEEEEVEDSEESDEEEEEEELSEEEQKEKEEKAEEAKRDTERTEDRASQFRMLDELDTSPEIDHTVKEPEVISKLEFDEIEYISEDDMASLVTAEGSLDRASLNKTFNKVGVQAFKQALKALPAVYSALMKETRENQAEVTKFYKKPENAILAPYTDIMSKLVGKIRAKDPNLTALEALNEARTKTVTLLGLKEKVISSSKKSGKQKGKRPPSGKGKGKASGKPSKQTALQKRMESELGI